RGYWSLIATQFQGAFNENGLKFLVIFLLLAGHLSEHQKDVLTGVVGGVLFALPFILFSMAGGYLAARFGMRKVTLATKVFELAVMGLAAYALARNDLDLAFVAVFLASTQAALFGPSKYGLLPELLPPERLSWGNGILEFGTFLAIIGGTMAGAFLADAFAGHEARSGLLLLACSLVGLVCALGITRVPAADPQRQFRFNAFADLWEQWAVIRRDRVLTLAVAGSTWFWFLAALLQFDIVIYGQQVLHLTATRGGLLQAAVGVGVGVGSLAAGFLSGGKIEYGLVPLGALGMTALGFALALDHLGFGAVSALLAALGFASGFFAVPVNALIQHRPAERDKSAVIAAANLLSFVGIAAASGVYYLLSVSLRLGPSAIFFWAAAATLAATVYVLRLLPDALLRLLLWFVTHSLYRIRASGRENLPAHGGALLVPNHASLVDAALLLASTDRPIRFLMFQDLYERPWLKPFAKILGVIPISSQQRPRELIHSLRQASAALRQGELVCIFPEGEMTRIGRMLPFHRGMERILKDADVPVIPVHLDGLWGSVFSFAGGRYLWKRPRHLPYPVSVVFGPPLHATTTADQARQAVQALGPEAFAHRRRTLRPLPRAFIRTARRHPFRLAMADGNTPRVRYLSALVKSIYLARRLRPVWRGQEKVGILLPPSVPGALINHAALLLGKVPVHLNYTASNDALESCARQCSLANVLTARAFLEKVPLKPPAAAAFLEDIAKSPTIAERLLAFLAAVALPPAALCRWLGADRLPQLDDTATIIFSSGSTGEPKGVILSHYNIAANVAQLDQVFALGRRDRILGILPFFHSFGFTATLVLPAVTGIGAVFHPNPLEARAIGAAVQRHAVTLMVATPTFLQTYTRRCEPGEFGSLRLVLAGAEKMPERIAQAFEDRFGIRPLEGYGCTECAPVVAANSPGFRAASFHQVGAKRGTVGHPLPGMGVRIEDPETRAPLPANQPGLLWVRGPNVMQGYLGRPEQTAAVLQEGWYNTGDIAAQDEHGFLRITDRLSRFSKIAGEMVPHLQIEELLHPLAAATEQVFAVTAVPDDKKGERLIVLHTLDPERLQPVLEQLAQSSLPALWRPRPDQFLAVAALPCLGTGKLDLRQLRQFALAATASRAAPAS
ncbi:MAG TPA: acyl-[ACP]--phospholipid O-acyltransferase, partial [Terriglobales bacterium]|nr:acyl-[ACP]--phospholipid O-acyltransferase [Terriglobales bacterium]